MLRPTKLRKIFHRGRDASVSIHRDLENTDRSNSADPHSPGSNIDTFETSDGNAHHDLDEHVETEFVEISGKRTNSRLDRGDCSIFFHQPRISLFECWASDPGWLFKVLRDVDACFYDSFTRPDSDFSRPCGTAAMLLHYSWHGKCRKPWKCQLKEDTPSCLVEPSLFKECDIGLACAVIRGWHEAYNCKSHAPPKLKRVGPKIVRRPYGKTVFPKGRSAPLGLTALSQMNLGTAPTPLSLSNMRLRARDWGTRLDAHITPFNTICDPYTVFPRRLWDVDTNRVVPAWLCYQNTLDGAVQPKFAAISHSWRPHSELVYVETPINAFAWPVPLPAGLDLGILRSQIQKHNYRYVWLDVLCLRQVHSVPAAATRSPNDQAARDRRHRTTDSDSWIAELSLAQDSDGTLLSSELAIDVPTIGNIYRLASQVFRFLNGLGQPLSLTGWDLPTHWLNRVWTLQEHVPQSIDLGIKHIRGNYLNLEVAKRGHTCLVREHLQAIYGVVGSPTLLGLVAEMGRRFATNEVDKVAGLSYALQLPELPTYAGTAGVEAAWRRCLAVLPPGWVAELFFNCPLLPVHVDVERKCQWTPLWEELVGLPPSFMPYAVIPRESVLQAASGAGSMMSNVACIFPSSIAHVKGTKGDYVVLTGNRRMRRVTLFLAHNGLDLNALTRKKRLVMARPLFNGASRSRPHGWVETWVLLHMLPKTDFKNRLGTWVDPLPRGAWASHCRKLGVFRSDTEVPREMETNAVVEVHVDGEIYLTVKPRLAISRRFRLPRRSPVVTSSEDSDEHSWQTDTESEVEDSELLKNTDVNQADIEIEVEDLHEKIRERMESRPERKRKEREET